MAPTMEKLANLLEFAVCFDKIKVSLFDLIADYIFEADEFYLHMLCMLFVFNQSSKPEIQNDLSYFRRMVAVNATSNQLER